MYYCSTKDDIIQVFKNAGKPLDAEDVQTLEEEEIKLKEIGESLLFIALEGQCRVCNNTQICIVAEICVNIDDLECMNCGNKAVQEKDEPEWWQEGD